ncbi:MAG TPA: hypothetical protein VGG78_06925 [Gemmatimonadaceae bacterium]
MSDASFERRVRVALSAPVETDVRTKEAIMTHVRAAAARSPSRRDARVATRRGTRYSIIGLAFAASIGSITTASILPTMRGTTTDGAVVIGDTVVGTLRDTLRLVRLMLDAPEARRVAVVGDFNGWHADTAPMHRDRATHRWSTTLALRDGRHRYAFVVDGTRWTPGPSADTIRADDGRVYSLLHVAPASN